MSSSSALADARESEATSDAFIIKEEGELLPDNERVSMTEEFFTKDENSEIVLKEEFSILDDVDLASFQHEPLVEVKVEGEVEALRDVSSSFRAICANFSQGILEFDGKTYFFKCMLCDAEFKTKEALDAHLLWHKETNLFQCGYCHEKFNLISSLEEHLACHQCKFWCSLCKKGFNDAAQFNYHEIFHSKGSSINRPLPPKVFSTKPKLKEHLVFQPGGERFKCECCGSGFASNSGLKRHQAVHSKKKTLSCDHCDKKFKSKKRLMMHLQIKQEHLQIKQEFACSTCCKIFSDNMLLLRHLKTHSKKKTSS